MEKPDKKVRSFRLLLQDSATHGRLWSVRFTRTQFIWAAVSGGLLLLLLIFGLIAFTPIRTFIPGYPDAQTRRQAVQNALRIDSLQTRILQWELYTENLRRIVAGEDPIRMDGLISGSERDLSTDDSRYYALRDSLLRADVLAEEQFEVNTTVRRNLPIEALSFFTPVKGVVSKGFDRTLHPWIDITAPAGTMVMAVLDGTVVYSAWEEGSGYTLAIQHSGDIISIYKNNQKILRKTGDAVKAGTAVGVLASSASLTKGDHLHFELWSDGKAVDPAQYIKF